MPSNSHNNTSSRIARNVSFNWAGICVEALVGFAVLPLLIARLGDTGYGLWIIIGSLAGYCQILDFGLRSSIGRFVAFYHAKEDVQSINRIVSSALAMLIPGGLLAGGIVCASQFLLPSFVEIPDDMLSDVRISLMLIGLNLFLWFILRPFDATLWGFQRFDLLTAVDIPITLLRLTLCYLLVTSDGGLVTLGVITLTTTLLAGILKAKLCHRQEPQLSLNRSFVDSAARKELLGFGWWSFVGQVSGFSKQWLVPILLGGFLSPAIVVLYTIARRLVGLAEMFINAAIGVITPVCTSIHSDGDTDRQQRLFLKATQYSACLVTYLVCGELLLGRFLITLWVGPEYSEVDLLLLILLLGQAIVMLGATARSVLLGTANHKNLAYTNVVDAIGSLLGVAVLGYWFGLPGACIAISTCSLIFGGIAHIILACRHVNVRCTDFLMKAVSPSLMVGALPISLLIMLTYPEASLTWSHFIGTACLYSFAWFVVGICYFKELRQYPIRWLKFTKTS